jgi:short-chain dehydrogenase/reductase SDR
MITGKKIVLTGANSGIGLETLKLLVQGNNKILAVDLKTDVISTFDQSKVFPMQCDVGNKEGIDKIFEVAKEKLGTIDIFYANAGFPYYEQYNYADWDRVNRMFQVNTISPMYTYGKYLDFLKGRDGHFCITVSAIGQMAMPGYCVYSASKFGTQGFQQGLRLELPENVTMTCPVSRRNEYELLQNRKSQGVQETLPRTKPRSRGKENGKGYRTQEEIRLPLRTVHLRKIPVCDLPAD